MTDSVRSRSSQSRLVPLALLLAALTLFAVMPCQAQEGVTTKRDLPAVRVETPPILDGDLGDACWQQAAKADRFTDVLFGTPVADQTVAYLCYDNENIYVAFYAYDSQPQALVARETKRGTRFNTDDRVAFSIDTFHTHKFADRSFFLINPIGTQFARLGGERATKLEWEGAWQAATKVVADGWIVEVSIPWSILNYPTVKGPTTCGINFDRTQQRTKIHSWWSNLGQNEFNELDGHWVGVEFPPYRPQLSLLPYTTPGWEEGRGAGQRSGLDVRYTPTPSLTLVSTLNPDFANIEGAVEGIDFSYGERFVPDRRPFFLEGASIYRSGGVPGRYFHSLRIPDFDTGVNLYGKLTPRDTIGILGAFDFGRRADWVLRGRHEFGPTSSVDVALINRDSSEVTNRVAVIGENFRRGYSGSTPRGPAPSLVGAGPVMPATSSSATRRPASAPGSRRTTFAPASATTWGSSPSPTTRASSPASITPRNGGRARSGAWTSFPTTTTATTTTAASSAGRRHSALPSRPAAIMR